MSAKVIPITLHRGETVDLIRDARREIERRNSFGYPVVGQTEKPGMFQSRRQLAKFFLWTIGMAFATGLAVSWIVEQLCN